MKKIFLVLFCGVVIGLALSLLAAEMIERTAGDNFCSSCHSMKRMTRAYADDVHGGNNPLGFKAKCVDCHLPHDSVFHYLIAKATTGAKDVTGEIFWAKSFDWVANLKNKEKFTYTSGCLQCHDLRVAHYGIPKAFPAHKEFLSGKVGSCLVCHEHVGHKDLKTYLVNP